VQHLVAGDRQFGVAHAVSQTGNSVVRHALEILVLTDEINRDAQRLRVLVHFHRLFSFKPYRPVRPNASQQFSSNSGQLFRLKPNLYLKNSPVYKKRV
jgi:hypothetical protein